MPRNPVPKISKGPKIRTRMTFDGDWAAILDEWPHVSGVFVAAEAETEEEALRLLKEKLKCLTIPEHS